MTFNILSLDGGGIRGVLSATILKEVEKTLIEKTGKKLHEYFHLIAGTSTGSILAAGIASGISANELFELYNEEGKNIFPKRVRWQRKWRFFSQLLGNSLLYPHKYGDQGLTNVLKRRLIDKDSGEPLTIQDIKKTQFLILSYDVLSRNTTWFANDDPTEWYYKNNLGLWQICSASSSAPTFFPPYELPYNSEKSLPHIDGGVSANNPELAAIAHALSMTRSNQPKTKIDEISVLSIGTGRTTRAYRYSEIKKWGAAKWVANLPHIFLDPSSEISEHTCQRLFLSEGLDAKNYLRLDFDLNKRCKKEEEKHQDLYNEYIFERDKKNCQNPTQKKVCEDIDNPDACPELIEAAECYLEFGKVYDDAQEEWVPVRSAIEQFIDSHLMKDKAEQPQLAEVNP